MFPVFIQWSNGYVEWVSNHDSYDEATRHKESLEKLYARMRIKKIWVGNEDSGPAEKLGLRPHEKRDVHTEHCCKNCGCKYGDDDGCSVINGNYKQSYVCGELGVCVGY